MGCHGSPLGPCGRHLAPFGRPCASFGSLWGALGGPWAPFGVSWGALGLPLVALGGSWGPLWLLSQLSCNWEPRVSRSHTYSDKICDSGTRAGSDGSDRNGVKSAAQSLMSHAPGARMTVVTQTPSNKEKRREIYCRQFDFSYIATNLSMC